MTAQQFHQMVNHQYPVGRDDKANAPVISSDTSPATVRVIRTDEEVMIARDVCRLLGFSTINEK